MSSGYLALSSHQIELSDEEREVQQQIEDAYRRAGLSPPEATTVGEEIGASAEVVERMLRLLLRERVLVKVESLVFHTGELERLKTEVVALKGEGPRAEIDVAMFKERFQITRKYAIPLLGYLDRERITRRMGTVRVVL